MTIITGGVSTSVKVKPNKPYSGTNIGGYVFDAFLRMDHQSRLEITKHPVQIGANITDHSYSQPKIIEFEIGMTDVAKASKYNKQFDSGNSRSVTAYKILKQMQEQRIPLQVTTRLGIFNNMLIKEVRSPDDYLTKHGLRATVIMEEVPMASVGTYKMSADGNKTGATNRGTVTSVPFNGFGGSGDFRPGKGVSGSW